MKLSELEKGGEAIIRHIEDESLLALRLMEFGLVPGMKIKRVGKAPLGDPLEFQIHGFRLTLRKKDASKVILERS